MKHSTAVVSEKVFQQQIIELASLLGYRHLHVRKSVGRRGGKAAWQTTTNLKGWVDLLLWKPGRILAVELKAEKGWVTPEQRDVLASLAAAGVESYVWRPSDFDEAQRVLSRKVAA